ncbi:Cse1-domain-containing protein [Cantharellus anzutake]|uniref:Cse1-domain-containing protein n=1 Tax=Cantharellus anzutake TaxID=1750568 RepID=UPI00190435DC|nr:Cse1-domain-containing protein [Cantharellus anzutake]KAF8329082.1 Cse1-domain-containing protein [Cantharellus anzutake]
MSEVSSLFAASLSVEHRKSAEAELENLSVQQGFLPYVLQIVLDQNKAVTIRQAACLYFKNQIRRRWEDEDEPPISEADKATIRENLVTSMVSLSSPTDKLLRMQIGEAVSAVASSDFPNSWGDLMARLVNSFSSTDYNVNLSVLQTAHNIFLPWRAATASNELYSTINLALSQFQDSYFALFRATAPHLLTASITDVSVSSLLGETMELLFSLYYDLVAQDLPPAFEDVQDEFFGKDGGDEGWFLKFLKWDPPLLQGDPDDPTPSKPLCIRTIILEICELYTQRYNELLSPRLGAFIQTVWELIGASGDTIREDAMVTQAIRFLSVNIKSGSRKDLFSQEGTLQSLCERIIIPSMALREHEVEQFEDDPLEYIRRDLSAAAEAAGSTRRHAAGDLVRALMSVGFEGQITEIIMNAVNQALATYKTDPNEWKAKDAAIYLFTSIASLGTTTSQGGTSTNALVDVISFFSENVYSDLITQDGSVHSILQVNSIRFIYTFRYQLTKEQLLAVLPALIRHLSSSNYVSYTYAAVTIERILFIKRENHMLFSQVDVAETARPILLALFTKIRGSTTPEKIAENDYLMKCVMRVVVTGRQALFPIFQEILSPLVAILTEISRNPSNPNFNQYCFESIAALLRFVVAASPTSLETFENTLFAPFQSILKNDVDQFVPYVLQIISQMLELHTGTIPPNYGAFLPLLLTPVPWQQKGSIPALVRLLRAYLVKDAASIVRNGQLMAILAVIQQRLIPSKMNDSYGFELLQTVIVNISVGELSKHFNVILLTLLNRLQSTKTDKYALGFVQFLCFTMAVQVEGLNPGFVVNAINTIQGGLWTSILGNIVLPQLPKFLPKDRKLVTVGLARLLTQCDEMLQPPNSTLWPSTLVALLELLNMPGLTKDLGTDADTEDLSSIDHEEQNAGYQAAFTRLAASTPPKFDPVAYVGDAKGYLKLELSRFARNDSRADPLLVTATQGSPLLQVMFAS